MAAPPPLAPMPGEPTRLPGEAHRQGGMGFRPFRTNTSSYPNPMVGGSARIGGMPNIARNRSFGKPPKI
jgi:hypothetical protein